ncbi:unnamed protein product [Trichogramma brassicae]|uniref:Uncharacterized protein n=1 Tax=Trichogramma brassicae TaxID=86971 RepID=A0A6H5IVI0_9HYME|nr:unnamed protein product [Trichogramma brassicae]
MRFASLSDMILVLVICMHLQNCAELRFSFPIGATAYDEPQSIDYLLYMEWPIARIAPTIARCQLLVHLLVDDRSNVSTVCEIFKNIPCTVVCRRYEAVQDLPVVVACRHPINSGEASEVSCATRVRSPRRYFSIIFCNASKNIRKLRWLWQQARRRFRRRRIFGRLRWRCRWIWSSTRWRWFQRRWRRRWRLRRIVRRRWLQRRRWRRWHFRWLQWTQWTTHTDRLVRRSERRFRAFWKRMLETWNKNSIANVLGNAEAVSGSYSYTGPDGQVYTINYTADETGFHAQGAHIPTPPPIPPEIQRGIELSLAAEARGENQDGAYRGEGGSGGKDTMQEIDYVPTMNNSSLIFIQRWLPRRRWRRRWWRWLSKLPIWRWLPELTGRLPILTTTSIPIKASCRGPSCRARLDPSRRSSDLISRSRLPPHVFRGVIVHYRTDSPVIILKVVDLPAPFTPRSPKHSCCLTPKLISSTAKYQLLPYLLYDRQTD